MPVSGIDVHYVAQLARLALTPEEERHLGAQLQQVLGYVEKLQELEVTGVEPTAHPLPRPNVCRPDAVRASLTADQALANAPATSTGLFRMPRIVE